MHFTDIFIRRPVFATVLSLIILLVGLKAFSQLPIRQYPNIQPSVISVTASYPGASAKLMEGFVTTPLENTVGGVEGIDAMTSTSQQGMTTINLEFKLGYDLNKAIADVSNAVSSARWKLPSQIQDPIIAKNDPNAEATLYISFTSDTMDVSAITDYLLRVIQPQFQTVPGVSQSRIFGDRQYAMRIWLDPKRMAAHKVTPSDVLNSLAENNIQAAPGVLKSPMQQININAHTDIDTPQEFNQLVLRNQNGYLIRLGDVGRAELGPAFDDVSVNMSGNKNAVVIGIIPQATANPLAVAASFNKLLPEVQAQAPKGLHVRLLWDWSKFIAESLKEVKHTIFEACLCVVLVIFVFLGSFRSVIIPVVTIPLSIIGVCGIMLALGYTINTLTLLAWVLAIGLVVDDAIVVLENIHRHIELGQKPFQAAIIGAREIGFAIIAMTLTLAAVYAPIGFMTDMTGLLFREFAFTLAASVVISGFVALTLSPMMCSKLLSHEIDKKGLVAKIDTYFNTLMEKYKIILSKALHKRKIVIIIGLLIYIACYALYKTLPAELAPEEDQGAVMAAAIGPTSANLHYVEKYTGYIEKAFKNIPDIVDYGIINGVPTTNKAFAFAILKPWNERKVSVSQVIQQLMMQMFAIPGLQAFAFNMPSLPSSGGGDAAVSFVLKTTGSYEELNQTVDKIMARIAKENPRLLNPNSDLKLDLAQANIEINRNKANALGISMMDIANALNTLLGQPQSSLFEMNGRSYYVIPQLYPRFMTTAEQLNNINLRTTTGEFIPLSNVVHIHEGVAPQTLNHFQQLRSATITANLAPGYTLGEALAYLKTISKDILPENTQYDFSGQSRQFFQASGSMEQTFLFAIIFIFLVLAAQFESFRDPLIVMLSVPLSLAGALLTIHLAGGSLNIYTQIGLITLIGLITKHGILIVEFANQIQEQKKLSIHDAVLEAAALRLRPILMTTGAMVLGALPLALASGAGANSRSQLGWTIFGGMSIGTLFTLFIIPVVYSLLASKVEEEETLPDEQPAADH